MSGVYRFQAWGHSEARPFGVIWACRYCLCTDVQGSAWVDLNSGEDTGDEGPTEGHCCAACGIAGDGDIGRRGVETFEVGAPGVWTIPPSEWFPSLAAWEDQVLRLRDAGVRVAAGEDEEITGMMEG